MRTLTIVLRLLKKKRGKKVRRRNQGVRFYPPRDDVSNLAPFSHEDADTRIMVRVYDAVKHELKPVLI